MICFRVLGLQQEPVKGGQYPRLHVPARRRAAASFIELHLTEKLLHLIIILQVCPSPSSNPENVTTGDPQGAVFAPLFRGQKQIYRTETYRTCVR